MGILPQEGIFSEVGSYDDDCCEACRAGNALIKKWRERIDRVQAASEFAKMDEASMTIKLDLSCMPSTDDDKSVAVQLIAAIEKPENGAPLSARKEELMKVMLGSITEAMSRLWSIAFMSNETIEEMDLFLGELRGETGAEKPSHFN